MPLTPDEIATIENLRLFNRAQACVGPFSKRAGEIAATAYKKDGYIERRPGWWYTILGIAAALDEIDDKADAFLNERAEQKDEHAKTET